LRTDGLNKLFEPGKIGTMEVRNRIVFPPMGTGFADASGHVTDRMIQYCVARARGGVGLFIMEGTSVSFEGKVVHQPGVYDDSFIPGLARLAAAVKQEGARIALQLHHGGRRARRRVTGVQPVAPSPIAPFGGEVPHELTVEEIGTLVEAYGQGAHRAKEAGFDTVEVHGGNGHLIAQFLSALTNKRRDRYGGDLESRARFALEICRRIRQIAGPDYPLMVRFVIDEYIKGGNLPRDGQQIARMLVKAGVDAIHTTSAYVASSEEGYIEQLMPASFAPMSYPSGHLIHLAQAIKQVVNVPVIGVGRISDPRMADRFIAEGKADFISMGRAIFADPDMPRKAALGRYDDIRKCLACNVCGLGILGGVGHVVCTVNAELGREKEYAITPTQKPKNVVVVGGGPAGMEAARVAALRGHRVTLLEKKDHLGGNLISASAVSFKRTIGDILYYLTAQLRKLPVEVELAKEATPETIIGLKPEAVILATGAEPTLPDVAGITRGSVANAIDVLSGTREVGHNVVVVGGTMVGCETAAFLADKGKHVTLVTDTSSDFGPGEGLAADMEASLRRWFLFELWPKIDVDVIARSAFEEVTDRGLVVRNNDGDTMLVEGDSIVFALDLTPSRGLEAALKDRVPELHAIGDCVKPRQIVNAVHEAARVARAI